MATIYDYENFAYKQMKDAINSPDVSNIYRKNPENLLTYGLQTTANRFFPERVVMPVPRAGEYKSVMVEWWYIYPPFYLKYAVKKAFERIQKDYKIKTIIDCSRLMAL